MTLRLRLVLALLALSLAGLALFGVVTYHLYADQQYGRLEQQLREARRPVAVSLTDRLNGVQPRGPGRARGPGQPRGPGGLG